MSSPAKTKINNLGRLQRVEWALTLQDPKTGVIPTTTMENERFLQSLSVHSYELNDESLQLYANVVNSMRDKKPVTSKVRTIHTFLYTPLYSLLAEHKFGPGFESPKGRLAIQRMQEYRDKIPKSEFDLLRRQYLSLLKPWLDTKKMSSQEMIDHLLTVKYLTPVVLVEGSFEDICTVIIKEGLVTVALDNHIDEIAIGTIFSYPELLAKRIRPRSVLEMHSIAMIFIRMNANKIWMPPTINNLWDVGSLSTCPAIVHQLIVSGFNFQSGLTNGSGVTFISRMIYMSYKSVVQDASDNMIRSMELVLDSNLPEDFLISTINQSNVETKNTASKIRQSLQATSTLGIRHAGVTTGEYTFVRIIHLFDHHLTDTAIDQLTSSDDFKYLTSLKDEQLFIESTE